MVHLIETEEAPAKPGNIHHAFQVDDLEATRATLESSGYEILRGGVRYDGQAYFFIEDPDGNSVEFLHRRRLRAGAAASGVTQTRNDRRQHHPGGLYGYRQEPCGPHRGPPDGAADGGY